MVFFWTQFFFLFIFQPSTSICSNLHLHIFGWILCNLFTYCKPTLMSFNEKGLHFHRVCDPIQILLRSYGVSYLYNLLFNIRRENWDILKWNLNLYAFNLENIWFAKLKLNWARHCPRVTIFPILMGLWGNHFLMNEHLHYYDIKQSYIPACLH